MMTFEAWCEAHEDDLWVDFHESGANYDTVDYELWCEKQYQYYLEARHEDQTTRWDHDTHSGAGTDHFTNACGADHRSR